MNHTKWDVGLLARLDGGEDFTSACQAMGDDGVKAAWNCLMNGWIERGNITAIGRAFVRQALKPVPWEITVVPSPSEDK
jgi:hypothetical protein